jgi:hypothetical protein
LDTYQVYKDIYIVDSEGNVLGNATSNPTSKVPMIDKDWCYEPLQTGTVYSSDMYFTKFVNDFTVAYSCPVRDNHGKIAGLISSRFNWNYIYDIIDSAKVGENAEIFLLNNKGLVLASKEREGILEQDLSKLQAFDKLQKGENYGFTVEKFKGSNRLCGFAKTKGYNTYKGKGWSVLILV